jgi:hypothetical protein
VLDLDYDVLRREVQEEMLQQLGTYEINDTDTNIQIVEDIRKAIDGIADGVIPSASHIAQVTVAANENLQIRDFLMGVQLEKDIDFVGEYVQLLSEVVTKEQAVPLATIFCSYLYQLSEVDTAKIMLDEVISINPDYALAKLLKRVFDAQWEPKLFRSMSEQLHHKVIDTIYERETNDSNN